MSKKHIPFVIAYDFDGTLAPGNMQEYDFIPALEMKSKKFWTEVKEKAKNQLADEILAYMKLIIDKAYEKEVSIHKVDFFNFGSKITFFPGVEEWFNLINHYGKTQGVNVEHYIISSGLREMIQGTKIAKFFKKIYASGFMYDQNDVANWPALAINYTTKTQYLFRINKNSLDEYDNTAINKYIKPEGRPVPFSHMLFIGDGETDIPCMRLVRDKGGHAIAVYAKGKRGAEQKAKKLVKDGRATLATVADYSENAAIFKAVKAMIDKLVADNTINTI